MVWDSTGERLAVLFQSMYCTLTAGYISDKGFMASQLFSVMLREVIFYF
jgi:hypothetical protein